MSPDDSGAHGSSHVLTVERLSVTFGRGPDVVTAVSDVSFAIEAGETLGLVGESGSGKSVTALALLRLVRPPGRITAGRVLFRNRDLLSLPEPELRAVRGAAIGFVFQEPMAALSPVMRVGDQIAEAIAVHGRRTRGEVRARVFELLDAVRLPDPARQARAYPHQLSGGMRQRAMLAIALACRPALLVADEPTTALDVTVQAEILDLLRTLRTEYKLSLLLISHDLGVIAQMADRVAVMHQGRIVEEAPLRELLRTPRHECTRTLLTAARSGVEPVAQ